MKTVEIGNRIKKRRQELGLTLQQVADEVKVNKSTIQRYETGNIKDIKLPVIESISKVLKVDPMWIIGEISTEEKHSPEYERITYLVNLYFDSVMKWSEDKLLNENETIILRQHFSDLLLRYKEILECYAYSKIHWTNIKENYETIYKNRLCDKEIKEIFLKQELGQKIKSLTDWIYALPNWISRNEKETSSIEEESTPYLVACHDDDLTDEEKNIMNQKINEFLNKQK